MAAPGRASRLQQAPALIVFVVAAVAFGAAAALLIGPSPPQATGGSPLQPVAYGAGLWIALGAWAGLFLVYILLTRAQRGGQVPFPATPALAVLGSAVIVAIILILAAPITHGLTGSGGGGASGPGNNTTIPPSGGGSTGTLAPGWTIAAWVPWIILGVIVGVVVLLIVPILVLRLRARETPPPEEPTRSAGLTRALRNLDATPDADPRTRILALYAQLLARVAPTLKKIDSLTAREVAAEVLEAWRVPPPAAATLTDLFEEARYSDHPMSESSVDRARQALRDALQVIDRPRVSIG